MEELESDFIFNLDLFLNENLPDFYVRYKGFLYNRDQFTVNLWIGKTPSLLLDKEFRNSNFQISKNLMKHLCEKAGS